jgi:hypothetical protein
MKRRGDKSERNSGEQRRLANLEGHKFKPGESGNPAGRPRTRGLVAALRSAVAETIPDGRTIEQAIADELVNEALRGRRRLPAIAEIFDRLEGKAKQSVDLDVKERWPGRSIEELDYFALKGRWPEKESDGNR